ncbi:indole-diterpene biosynthesis protein-like protein PaxU [Dendryphion nanum]|uniref:Indole-diterpene biosynthesis protein-like protein PaxU n=1 Tax=Dendryphion nanum TaxID=256645 RepID=A0A9P9IZC1_9PLEO|nr:indole-diterpene biosynthesis protein-like protein PaxU [Dendryphion nanum]
MAENPLKDFSHLTPTIHLYTPPTYQKGQLIVLLSWMGAANKHIAKYVQFHQKNFPNAKILLLKSALTDFIYPYATVQKSLEPAALAILSLLEECGYKSATMVNGRPEWETLPHIMFHLFSNGGMNIATQLLTVLHRHLKAPAPIVGIVCDSAPVDGSYWRAYTAITQSLPKRFPIGIAAIFAGHGLAALQQVCVVLRQYEQPELLYRRTIADEKMHEDPRDGSHRIAYVASKGDRLTPWRDVGSHAEGMREKGWRVKELVYEETAHCNHMAKDKNAYLDVVRFVWERREA